MEHKENSPSTSQSANINQIKSLIESKKEEIAQLHQEMYKLNRNINDDASAVTAAMTVDTKKQQVDSAKSNDFFL